MLEILKSSASTVSLTIAARMLHLITEPIYFFLHIMGCQDHLKRFTSLRSFIIVSLIPFSPFFPFSPFSASCLTLFLFLGGSLRDNCQV